MKILMLTTVYASKDIEVINNTSVCHYFSKEWVKSGHQVNVVYSYPIYLKILHILASIFKTQITRISNSSIRTKRILKTKSYSIDGVEINRIPIYKTIPLIKYSKNSIRTQISKIVGLNKKFKPDIIVGHFHNPNLELIYNLKKIYKVPTCLIVHGDTSNILQFYKSNYKELLSSIDIYGFRSIPIKNKFEKLFGSNYKSFICYSGIPKNYFMDYSTIKSNKLSNSFVFVGSLIRRKYPLIVLKALSKSVFNKNFSLDYVGDGFEKKSILKVMGNLKNKVKLHGKIERKKVQEIILKSQFFIMISENESFGLVYIEAMAKGCIVIASKNEGMDGVIVHGKNGFLCKAGNENELIKIINQISLMSEVEKEKISKNAINTAKSFSDSAASQNYLNAIINLNNNN